MGDFNDASAAARGVAQQGVPHPSIIEAALELLTLHPTGAVSHIPDLISGAASDVSTAVEAFGALLPTGFDARSVGRPALESSAESRCACNAKIRTRNSGL